MEKVFVPFSINRKWKNIAGRNARYRRNRFRTLVKEQLAITSDDYFYRIMRGEVQINESDIKVIEDKFKAI